MNPIDYQRVVLTHAVHAIACDGEIDPREISEIRRLVTQTPYFDALDAEVEITTVLNELRNEGSRAVERHLRQLGESTFSERHRMRLLEVLLHVVHADGVISEPERIYLQRVRAALDVTMSELVVHFPTRLALLAPPSSITYDTVTEFTLPDSMPDTSQFLGRSDK